MIVKKYGGSSVATVEKIKKIARRIKKELNGEKAIVVVSAMSGETDYLINLGKSVARNPIKREMDQLVSIGENKSVALMSISLNEIGVCAVSLTGWQAGIVTNDLFGNAFIREIKINRLKDKLKKFQVLVVAGFQGVTVDNNVSTLGKGGSDTTAVALASVFNCPCEIWTDVNGVFSADPKLLQNAKKINYLTYDELMEMSVNGAKVMETRSVEIAKKYSVELKIGKSLNNINEGTKVTDKNFLLEKVEIKNITVESGVSVLSLEIKNEFDIVELLECFGKESQKLLLSSLVEINGKKIFSCIIRKDIIEKIKKNTNFSKNKINFKNNLCKIALIGDGFCTHTKMVKEVVEELNLNKIQFQKLTITENSIMFVINEKSKLAVVNAISKKFCLEEK